MSVLGGLVAAVVLLALRGCKQDPRTAADDDAPAPRMWEIRDQSGEIRGWLFGTIHALPDGARWRTPLLERAIEQADLLAVEIATLDDRVGMAQILPRLATSPDWPDIGLRVPQGSRPDLVGLIEPAERKRAV